MTGPSQKMLDNLMFEVPGSRLRELTEQIATLSAERDAALALVGQLQGQLAAVRAALTPSATMLPDKHDESQPNNAAKVVMYDLARRALAAAVLSDREGTPNE